MEEIKTEVLCCSRHEKNVQLVWTFAFPGAEYWCPYCGCSEGMLGAGEIRQLTFSERREMIKYRYIGKEYLQARSTAVCSSLMWKGERIKPEDLPIEERKRIKKVIDEWEYPINKEEELA